VNSSNLIWKWNIEYRNGASVAASRLVSAASHARQDRVKIATPDYKFGYSGMLRWQEVHQKANIAVDITATLDLLASATFWYSKN
jgi:hypothetical protein